MPERGDGNAWMRDLPRVKKSAPGHALYETLEDFVFDQSEGEEGIDGDGESGDLEQEDEVGGNGGENEEAMSRSSSRSECDNADDRASPLLSATQRKRRRVRYAADEEIVLYLLHRHVSLQHSTRADIFNHIFHDHRIIREKGALTMQWSRFKDDYKKRFAKLSAAELAEHEVWKKKIDKAIKDAGVVNPRGDKQENDSDSADDHAPPPATTKPTKRIQRARYTADHELVVYLLYIRKNLDADNRTDIFNHVFRGDGPIRQKGVLGRYWKRHGLEDKLQKKFANLSPAELAEHEAWERKIDEAIEELFQ